MSVTMRGISLYPASQALGAFNGRLGVPLSVKLSNTRRRLMRYHDAWRTEVVLPLIKEFLDDPDATSVPEERVVEFTERYRPQLEETIEMEDVKPISLKEFSDAVHVAGPAVLDILLEEGLIIDADG